MIMFLRLSRAVALASKNHGILAQSTQLSKVGTFERYCSGGKHDKKAQENARTSDPSRTFIVLCDPDGKEIGKKSLHAARELAQKRKMSLIKFEAPTGKTEWYRMVPLKELNKRDASKKRNEMKVITFGVNIGEHDLKVKAKQAAKWISQNMEVRVAVSGETLTSVEQLKGTLQRLRTMLADTPHEEVESKPGTGMLKSLFKPPKATPTPKTENSE